MNSETTSEEGDPVRAQPEICLSGIDEQDISLLLVEEFVASPAFLAWFLQHVGIKPAQLLAAKYSVDTPNGESDLELSISDGSCKTKVLIENKINAVFQENQPERYSQRARNYIESGECGSTTTVLVAPAKYSGSSQTFGFDRRVSYEEILAWFQKEQPLSGRFRYKSLLIKKALEKKLRNAWDRESFFEQVSNLAPAHLKALESLYEWASVKATTANDFGSGKVSCFLPVFKSFSTNPAFGAYANGEIFLNFSYKQPEEKLRRQKFRRTLRDADFPVPDEVQFVYLAPAHWRSRIEQFKRILSTEIGDV